MAKFSLFALATWAGLAAAKDVYLKWDITWVNAAPDGFERPVIGVNGQWPCPQIDVNVGDQLIVDVYNRLGNESTAIHWHGMRQHGSGVMDGAVGVTQCPIAPGAHMQYHFDVNQTGTYWYHSHNAGQYPDGFRGALIVHDPSPPFHYDDEFTLTLSDWYHKEMPELLGTNTAASHGQEPLPDAALINDSTNTKIKVLPNKTYLVHIICVGNWPGHFWVFDGHEMTVVEVDGVYTEPYPAGDKFLRVATGQRMSVLIKTKPDASQNFAIWDTMDVNMMFIFENRTIPENYNPNATAWLVYDDAKPLPPPPVFNNIDAATDFVDDVTLVPADHEPILQPVDHQIILDTAAGLVDGVPRFTVNGKTYIAPKVPSLYTANTVGPEFSSNPDVYGQVNPFVVKYNEVVEIIINNHHNNLHPWHLHGHQFQVLQRTPVDGGFYTGLSSNVSHTPIRRDTIMVQNNGHTVIRFRADNPGVWMLHCHVEWHVETGLMATIIEAPETFQHSLHAPPQSHYDTCAAYPQGVSGNAAGKNGLDLTGLDTTPPIIDHGALYTATKGTNAPAEANQPQGSSQAAVPKPSPSSNTDGYWKVPHTDFYVERPDKPHDHHITIHEESTKGPWPNQNTYSGYVVNNGHSSPIKDSDDDDILAEIKDWE
ncbi:CAZyme family AA1 [Penicillium psychrosexuale]|uniref:CAZyme family AA1 n=1 Tax=Penicillium psychrosexuale TaxID=1002107 RepID=UPI002544F68F|nr:CAZyme family AA1 [Penicillium psychrosexuale]KAJ5803916.1 CAZyme family AA1 [Penicillium psychrosexuale]